MSNLKLNTQELAIKALLAENQITFNVVLTGEIVNKDNWTADRYDVVFEVGGKKYRFDFNQGIGHRVTKQPTKTEGFKTGRLATKKAIKGNHLQEWVIYPTAASVLYCLLLDSRAANESFDDWCSNLGYDTDSRKALELYLECQATSHKLKFLSGIRSQIETILEDF